MSIIVKNIKTKMDVISEAERILFAISKKSQVPDSVDLKTIKQLFKNEVIKNGFENIADETYRYIKHLSFSCTNFISEECDLFIGLYNHLLYLRYFDFIPQQYDYNELVTCLYIVKKANKSCIGLSIDAAKNTVTYEYWNGLISSVKQIEHTPVNKK